MNLSPPEWTLRAECRDLDPAEADHIFYSYRGRAEARTMCRACPVVRECLERCAEIEETWQWGLWAGTTPEERKNYLVNGSPNVEAALIASR